MSKLNLSPSAQKNCRPHTRSGERDGEMKKAGSTSSQGRREYLNVVVAMIPSAKQEPNSHHPNIPPSDTLLPYPHVRRKQASLMLHDIAFPGPRHRSSCFKLALLR